MKALDRTEKLAIRLCALFDLERTQARQIVAEVLDGCDETVDTFIENRHAELQHQGLKNDAIYTQLEAELTEGRFKAPPLTPRQIRRRVYG